MLRGLAFQSEYICHRGIRGLSSLGKDGDMKKWHGLSTVREEQKEFNFNKKHTVDDSLCDGRGCQNLPHTQLSWMSFPLITWITPLYDFPGLMPERHYHIPLFS